MLSGKDIVDMGKMTELSLTLAVMDGVISALDPNTLAPINWKQLKNDFYKIQALSKQDIPVAIQKTVKDPNFDRWNLDNIGKNGTITIRTTENKKRINVCPDEYIHISSGKMVKMSRISWDDLLRRLESEKYEIPIPRRQEKELSGEWGIQIMIPYVLNSLYQPMEITKITEDTINHSRMTQKINPRRENNLLKIIGGFIQINYLNGPNKETYTHGGKPNAKAIAENFLNKLRLADFSDEGIKDRMIRELIPDAIEQIENNKID